MEGERKKSDKRMLLVAITVIVVVILLVLTFVVPDRNGMIRTDLEVGDYYVLESYRFADMYTIVGIDRDDLQVSVKHLDLSNMDTSEYTDSFTKDEFLSRVLFSDGMYQKAVYQGSTFQETPLGNKLCKILGVDLNEYNVDEYGVIYQSAIGGNFWRLTSTSLLYGADPSSMPVPKYLAAIL